MYYSESINIPDCKKMAVDTVFFNIPHNKKIKVKDIKILSKYIGSFNYSLYKWSSDEAYDLDEKKRLFISTRLRNKDTKLVLLDEDDIITDYFILEYRVLNIPKTINILDITYNATFLVSN